MPKKIVVWAVLVALVFGAVTHPATAGQVLHEGYAGVFSLAHNLGSFVHSVKGS